jgi:hypothetical protein
MSVRRIREEAFRIAQTGPPSPWWFDYGACAIVRTSDGRRWDVTEVPELHNASRALRVVDVTEVDRWVLAQPAERDA